MRGFIKNIILYQSTNLENWIISRVVKKADKDEKKIRKKNNKTYKVVKNGKEIDVKFDLEKDLVN